MKKAWVNVSCLLGMTMMTDQSEGKVWLPFYSQHLILILLSKFISVFTHLKLFPATATHNFIWVKVTHICLIWDQPFWNIDAEISFPISLIWSGNPFNPEFTIVIFIHYKSRIAMAILDL